MFGVTFKQEVDAGAFIAALVAVAGVASWFIKSLVAWRRHQKEESRNGALRVLLRLLRDAGRPLALTTLQRTFEAESSRGLRQAYCRQGIFLRDFRFTGKEEFEAAIYRLDYEGKIDFVDPDTISFRTDRLRAERERSFAPTHEDAKTALDVLEGAAKAPEVVQWQFADMLATAMQLDPSRASTILRGMLMATDVEQQRRAVAVMGRFLADPRDGGTEPPAAQSSMTQTTSRQGL
jgi:hypothetical protein